jgi:glutamyl-tRNA reductase
LSGITLYDMDDLQREAARNMSGREAEAARARAIVEQEVERFGDWVASLDVVPTVTALRARGEEIVQRVMRENESRWESLNDADRERVETLARAVVNRLLHEPTLRIKAAAEKGGSYVYLQALRELFGLDPEAADYELDQQPPAQQPARVTSIDERRRRSTGRR